MNGTMVYPERNFSVPIKEHVPDLPSLRGNSGRIGTISGSSPSTPAVVTAPAFIQISYQGRKAQIAQSDECECVNPWDGFSDPLGASTCSVTGSVTVCLVKTSNLSKSSVSNHETLRRAHELLAAIDAEFQSSSGH